MKASVNDLPLEGASPQQALPATALWVLFSLDKSRYALPLSAVDRVVRAAQITLLPRAPAVVLGALDVAGDILPVFNLRCRFGLPERSVQPSDHFLIARAAQRTVVLPIDTALDVIEQPAAAITATAKLSPDLPHIHGVIRLENGLVLVQDLDEFLSADESSALSRAMNVKETSYEG